METKMSEDQKEQEKKWKVESDARTLREAEEIKKDSERMKGVQGYLEGEMKMLSQMDKMFPSMGKKEG